MNGEMCSAQQTSDLYTLPIPAAMRWSSSTAASSVSGSSSASRARTASRSKSDSQRSGPRRSSMRDARVDRSSPLAFAAQLDDGRGEADRGRAVVDAHDDARGVAGPAPAFARSVDVPDAGHLHVRVQHVSVGEPHEQVLARRFDRR